MSNETRHYMATAYRKDGTRFRVCGFHTSAAAFGEIIRRDDPAVVHTMIRESVDCDAPTPVRSR